MKNHLRAAVIPALALEIDGETYTVEYPLAAVAAAEETLGRTLKSPSDWFCAPTKDIPALLEAGLRKHHRDDAAEVSQALCERLNAESCAALTEALGALNFPLWLARFQENLAKGKSPKAEGVAAR